MKEKVLLREDVLEQLEAFGISGKNLYFIDFIPLIEMIWADGQVQKGELDIFYEFLQNHVRYLNQMAGYDAFELDEALKFANRFLKTRPSEKILKTLRKLASCSGTCRNTPQKSTPFRQSLLAICLDIAASSVTEYPHGRHERFNTAEKQCFFEILDTLDNQTTPIF